MTHPLDDRFNDLNRQGFMKPAKVPRKAKTVQPIVACNRCGDAARLEGFADCESLIGAMLSSMATAEADKASRANAEAERLREAGCSEETIAIHGRLAHKHYARSATLREACLAVSVGQHRTDAYGADTLTAAHRAAVNRPLAARAGRAVSPAKAAAARANGAKGGRPKKEIQ